MSSQPVSKIVAAFQDAAIYAASGELLKIDGIPGPVTKAMAAAVFSLYDSAGPSALWPPQAAPAGAQGTPAIGTDLAPIVSAKLPIGHVFKNGGVLQVLTNSRIVITGSKVDIDADGANGQHGQPPAYAPKGWGTTLDNLANAGHPGNWWALATDTGYPFGNPLIQGPNDPCPGAYISMTSLVLLNPDGSHMAPNDPRRYVDAATVPFLVICSELRDAVGPAVFGCLAMLTNNQTGMKTLAVVADGGNSNEMGEISLGACASNRLNIPGSAHGVGTDANLLDIEIYPGTAVVIDGVTYPLQPS